MEYFGVFQRLLGHFVLISFRTYDGFLMLNSSCGDFFLNGCFK